MLGRRFGDLFGDRILQPHQRIQCFGADRAVGEHRELSAHARDPAAQFLGCPRDGRGRVVQLMGEPGRQLTQREQLLAIVDEPAGPLGADGDPVEQVHRHRELVFHERGERRCVHHEEPRRFGHVHRRGVKLLLLAGKRLPRTAIHAAMRCPIGLDVLAAGELRHRQLALRSLRRSTSRAHLRRRAVRARSARSAHRRTMSRAARRSDARTGTACVIRLRCKSFEKS